MVERLNAILAAGQASRDAGEWPGAIRLFKQAAQIAPEVASIRHNLALSLFASGEAKEAAQVADIALSLSPTLWQSHALLAKIARQAGHVTAAEASWIDVLRLTPDNGLALSGLADIWMNELGDPDAALRLVEPLLQDPAHAADAELTTLMGLLYLGSQSAAAISKRLVFFSKSHMRLPLLPTRTLREGRRRIGIISPLFSNSPVYYLTYSTFQHLAAQHDLVFFNRGRRVDEATEAFRRLALQWSEVAALEPSALSEALAEAELDILFDLGGWCDVQGLTALSSKPAARMYKWVGGQSATTGMAMFDGWIGDEWQSPKEAASLYAEPILNIPGGYVDYTPPASLSRHFSDDKKGVGLVGNPAKIGTKTIQAWPQDVTEVKLIDRRYTHDRTRQRVTELLDKASITVSEVIVPVGHDQYLHALGKCAAIVNTQPYSVGLTAVEAHWLGVRVLSGNPPGALFCSRHQLSHGKTGGRNLSLASQILKIVSE